MSKVGAVILSAIVEGDDASNNFSSAAVGTPVATASLNAAHHCGANVPHSPPKALGNDASAKKVPAQNFLYGP